MLAGVPFTPTHTLAAVPLARIRWLAPSALAIGCMVPDVPLFFPATPHYATTHSWGWGPLSCLPYGLLAFALFRLCRGPAIGLAPEPVRRALAQYAEPDLRLSAAAWASVVASIALGVWTHIFWDGFTHAGRFGSALIPQLALPWLTLSGHAIPGSKVLQYGSSVVGLPLLAVIVARWYRRQPADHAVAIAPAGRLRRVLACLLLIAAPTAGVVVAWSRALRAHTLYADVLAYEFVTHTLATYLVGFVALTLPQRLLSGKLTVLAQPTTKR